MSYPLSFTVNGQPVKVEVQATDSLLKVLREDLRITSPKVGCNSGDCGACTVIIDGKAVKSCVTLALSVEGRSVETLEGIGTMQALHPIQRAFHEHYASQCGFCTPGMIMSAKALLDANPNPSRDEVIESLAGNLCRCTGYAKIVEAVMAAAEVNREGGDKAECAS